MHVQTFVIAYYWKYIYINGVALDYPYILIGKKVRNGH